MKILTFRRSLDNGIKPVNGNENEILNLREGLGEVNCK